MNLPKVITELVTAQNNHNSAVYINCFTTDAVVFDEGKNHQGTTEIKQWIEKANEKYQTLVEPIEYTVTDHYGELIAKISGTFEGSPIVLKYQLEYAEGLVRSLKITS